MSCFFVLNLIFNRKGLFVIYFAPILMLPGCGGKKEGLQGYSSVYEANKERSLVSLEEEFDSDSYERTLQYIGTFSVFSSPGDNFVNEVHGGVFSALSEDDVWKDQDLGVLLREMKLNDESHAYDFKYHLDVKRCEKIYRDESGSGDYVEKIKVCIFGSNISISELDEILVSTKFFGLANKLALEFADPFGRFIVQKELGSILDAHSAEEEVDFRVISDSIGYIKIKSFESEHLATYLNIILTNYEATGVTKIILDLRGNHGGKREVTEEVASLFLPFGVPFLLSRSKNNKGHWDNFKCERVKSTTFANLRFKGRIVVLTDHETASAGEALVAALQANRRGLIIGQKTFGKGIGFFIGLLNQMGYKSNGIMTLSTIILYHPETERSWHREPLIPDILLEEDVISKTTMEEWEIKKDKVPYRMSEYNHISNRELKEGLRSAGVGSKVCKKYFAFNSEDNEWDLFKSDSSLHQKLIKDGKRDGFGGDLPLYIAIKGLEEIPTVASRPGDDGVAGMTILE